MDSIGETDRARLEERHRVVRRRGVKTLTLRIDERRLCPVVTAPPHVSDAHITAFLQDHHIWIEESLRAARRPMIESGSFLPLCGRRHRVIFTGQPPRGVKLCEAEEGPLLCVGGPAEFAGKRLEAYLRARALVEFEQLTAPFAARLGVTVAAVKIGDARGRWGSCSNRGVVRFSFRLILAPVEVQKYVAAHEVAHLREMNHSPRFWQHVTDCVGNWTAARRWLKTEGSDLMRLRFT